MSRDLDQYIRFHRLWREFQKQNRFIGRAYGGEKTPVSETHVLLELEEQAEVTLRHLASALDMAMTSLMRTIDNLIESGYIETRAASDDRRSRVVALTAGGREFLKGHHQRNETQIGRITSRLTQGQLEQLIHYFHELADGLGESLSRISPRISPFRREIIRLTRAHGLLRKQIFPETSLTFLQWHILAGVTLDKPGASAQDLCEAFSVPVNTMAAAISKLVHEKLITRSTDEHDKRRWSLKPSPKGVAQVSKIEEMDARRYRDALKRLSPEQLKDLDFLWSKLIGWGSAESSFLIQQRITAKLLVEKPDIQSARQFLLEEYYRRPPQNLSGNLLHPESDNYALYTEEQIVAVLELWPATGGRTLGNLVVNESIKAQTVKDFILNATSNRLVQEPGARILIDDSALGVCQSAGVPLKRFEDRYALEGGEKY